MFPFSPTVNQNKMRSGKFFEEKKNKTKETAEKTRKYMCTLYILNSFDSKHLKKKYHQKNRKIKN